MGNTMSHSLLNPNQLRHFGIKVQDDPTSHQPLSIITGDGDFGMELKIDGTTIFADTYTPSNHELDTCPKIVLTSEHKWDPHKVQFPNSINTLQEEMGNVYQISSTNFSVPDVISPDQGDYNMMN